MSTTIEPQVLPPTELALKVPKETEALVAEPSRFELDANAYEVTSDASYQVADQIKESLKAEAKTLDEQRKKLTRPIDVLKKTWMDFFNPHITARTSAVATYEMKMIAFRLEIQRKRQEAQKEAERLIQKEKQEQLERARKLEERAAQLKTESAKERWLAEAEQIKQAAVLMPETIAISAAEPQGFASDTRDNWKAEPKQGRMKDVLSWLIDHPEWWSAIEFKAGEMKRLAKQFHNVQESAEPFRIYNDLGFASKRR